LAHGGHGSRIVAAVAGVGATSNMAIIVAVAVAQWEGIVVAAAAVVVV